MRSGSNSVIMPHEVVRDMMVARARPELVLGFEQVTMRKGGLGFMPSGYSDPLGLLSGATMSVYSASATLVLRNRGAANAYDVALSIETKDGFRVLNTDQVDPDAIVSTTQYNATGRYGFSATVYPLRVGRPIYPGTAVPIVRIAAAVPDAEKRGDWLQAAAPITIRYAAYARDFTHQGTLTIPKRDIRMWDGGPLPTADLSDFLKRLGEQKSEE
jgi:hypothetical protein